MIDWRTLAIMALALALAPSGARAASLENCVKAEAAYKAGEPKLEIALYTRCISDDRPRATQRAIAHNNRGVAHLALGDPNSAIEDYDRALSLVNDYAVAYANRGMAHLAMGDFVQALKDYGTAIDLDPTYAPAYANRCWLFGYMGYGDEALADCEQSLALGPADAAVLDSRAFAYWILEDQENARRDLERARRLEPSRPNWQRRFVEFEETFSVGYPYSESSVQSADKHEKWVQQRRPSRPGVPQANPH